MATVRERDGTDPASGRSSASIASTSGGVVAIGSHCAARYGRWAAWRGLPLPVAWVLAPVVAADMSAVADYFRQLQEFKQAVLAAAGPIVSGGGSQPYGADKATVPDDQADGTTAANVVDDAGLEASDGDHGGNRCIERMPSALELAVALAACESVEAQARTDCRPPAEDVALWRQELEQIAEVAPLSPPNGAVWVDIAGVGLGLAMATVARGRVRLQPFRAMR